LSLHFGDRSLEKFEADARAHGVTFRLYRSPALALDLDEPEDLERLAGAV
jgi:2-phospho-L-lactate guanylyltransferase (CobY/MobA/RfbA family)